MSPLRILHVSPYSADAWGYGGIPRLTGTLTRALAQMGHHVTVCATDVCTDRTRLPDGPSASRLAPHVPRRTADGVEVRLFPNVSNRLAYHAQLFTPIGLGGYLACHAASFDVAHLHACRNWPGVVAARYLARAGVPYLLAPNGTAPRLERRFMAKRVFDALAGDRVTRGASRVLAVSGAELRQLASCGIEASRLRRIANPLDLDEFQTLPPRGSFRTRLGLDAQTPLVVFLGKVTPRKRVDVLVRAFARLGAGGHTAHLPQLVVAGNDMGGLTAARALASDLNVGARVRFPGLVTGPDRLAALGDADVVVYASEHEVFGLVPFEALLCGTPVVVAGDSGCGELVHDVGGGHVVPAGDERALAGAIGRILAAPEPSRATAREAGARVRDQFNPGLVAAQLSDVYTEIVHDRRAA